MTLPLLIVVSGSSASGKSSLAVDLAKEMRLPLISRDDIKESIMDVFPVRNLEESHVAGSAAFLAMYRMIDRMLEAGVGAVVESTFTRGRAEDDLAKYMSDCRMIQVNCKADAPVIKARLAERIQTDSRHPGHQDHVAYVEIEDALLRGDFDALDLNAPLIQVNSNEGLDPDLDEIVRQIRTFADEP